jgi:4-hydroxybenzoate polyprenyltransferase
LAIALFLALLVLPLGYLLNVWFGCLATIYWFQNLAYSLRLKHVVIIDVLIIAFGFVLRVACGAVLVDVEQAPLGSPWIYMCIALGSLFIALGKRRHELTLITSQPNAHRDVLEHYTVPLIDWMLVTVSTSTLVAYSFYTFSAPNLPKNHLMMLTIPFVFYGLFRYLYLIHVEGKGGTPDKLFFEDHPLLLSVLLWAACAVGIMYWPYS